MNTMDEGEESTLNRITEKPVALQKSLVSHQVSSLSWWEKGTSLEKGLIITLAITAIVAIVFIVLFITDKPSNGSKSYNLSPSPHHFPKGYTGPSTSGKVKLQETTTSNPKSYNLSPSPHHFSKDYSGPSTSSKVKSKESTTFDTKNVSTKSEEFRISAGSREQKLCTTKQCILSASTLLQSIETGIDPCEDFYTFACGNWKKNHHMPDTKNINGWSTEKYYSILHNVRDFLRKYSFFLEPRAWRKAKLLYRSCVDTEKLDSLGLKPMLELLTMVGLEKKPLLPGSSSFGKNTTQDLNWLKVAAKAKKFLSIDLLIGLDIKPLFNPAVNIITLSVPTDESFMPGRFNFEDSNKVTVKSMRNINKQDPYLEYTAQVLGHVYHQPASFMIASARSLISLESTLESLAGLASLFGNVPMNVSIDRLQKLTDVWSGQTQINWTEYFSILFEDVPDVNISGDTVVYLSNPDYIRSIVSQMDYMQHDKTEILLWWKVIQNLVSHTTTKMREISEKFSKLSSKTEQTDSRSVSCARAVIKLMDMAVLSIFVNSDFVTSANKTMHQMYANIKDAFNSIVNSSSWVNDRYKKVIIEKIEDIVFKIGYPNWILDDDKLDEYYKGVEIHYGRFLLDSANLSRWNLGKKLAAVGSGRSTEGFLLGPLDVNAYYYRFTNSITFLSGLLQFPFYNLGHDALNYGITGSILAHEVSHVVGISGMRELAVVNIETDPDAMSLSYEFYNRSMCFMEQYRDYGWDAVTKFFCAELTETGKRESLHDVHSPSRFRVIGSISNSEEFSEIWKCPRDMKMNPSKKCKVW